MDHLSISALWDYLTSDDKYGLEPSSKCWWDQDEIDESLRPLVQLDLPSTDPQPPSCGHHLPWNGLSCLSLVIHVRKYCSSDSQHTHDDDDIVDIITRLDKLASKPYPWHDQNYKQDFAETFVKELIPKVQVFFTVPVRGKDHLAAFIDFLLQILNYESADQKERPIPVELHQSLLNLMEGLKFLLALLGDTPFQFTCDQMEQQGQVNNPLFLAFEDVANQVGSFLYTSIFRNLPVDVKGFHEGTLDLLEKFDLLNERIKEHCIKFTEVQQISAAYNYNLVSTSSIYAPVALLIVNSLLESLVHFILSDCHQRKAFVGKEWNTGEDEFQKLTYLQLNGNYDLKQWNASGEHLFPSLQHLVLSFCLKLKKIPIELGDIPTLRKIEVFDGCKLGVCISAIQIEQEQRENYGIEDLNLIIKDRRWSKEELVLMYEQMRQDPLFSIDDHDIETRVHVYISCDYCGMNPIFGDRYKCKDCVERRGFDLCSDCYSTKQQHSNLHGLHNKQKHTSEHEFEIITSSIY